MGLDLHQNKQKNSTFLGTLAWNIKSTSSAQYRPAKIKCPGKDYEEAGFNV
jgi:hypothetical protein